MQDRSPSLRQERDEYALGRQIEDKLLKKQLPQMVDWYDPALLAAVGVREVVSGTMGAYADQRQMQAATDLVDNEHDLVHRYDYGGAGCTLDGCTGQSPVGARGVVWDNLNPDAIPQSYWVDYIADLGDGFEATYAMAYLMAPETLEVNGCRGARGMHMTQAGRILFMGGDQTYPTATANEYRERLINPYNWAFSAPGVPQRKLFAIPGNHDWYDGLTAFDGVFCSARDRMSGGEGRKLGGWRSEQHRSYFAVKMPHNWWIWGADIQLKGHLDDAQKDYFDLVSEHMGRDDKVIICLAEPSWLHDDYQNLREIAMLASKADAKICAVLAGDWHHYSRYYAKNLGISFITCGGGGAFAHATHSLKRRLKLSWPVKTDQPHTVLGEDDSYEHNLAEERVGGGVDFKESKVGASAMDDDSTHAHSRRARRELELDPYLLEETDDEHECVAPHIYPKPMKSRLLSLWNVFFPFKHFKFAMALGVIYWLFSWVAFEIYQSKPEFFETIIPPPTVESTLDKTFIWIFGSCEMLGEKACKSKGSGKKSTDGATGNNASDSDSTTTSTSTPANSPTDQSATDSKDSSWTIMTLDFIRHATTRSIPLTLMVLGLWIGLILYVDVSWYKNWPEFVTWPMKIIIGTAHTLAHIMAIATLTYAVNFMIGGVALFAAESDTQTSFDQAFSNWRMLGPPIFVVIGGIFGGFVWGLYWAVTCALFNMHTGDAFGALALRDYKHFLRMKFEPDKVTIYAIKVDKVPGRRGWRPRRPQDEPMPQKSQLIPINPLKPQLIEPPIEIRAEDVWQRPSVTAQSGSMGAVPDADHAPVIEPGIPG